MIITILAMKGGTGGGGGGVPLSPDVEMLLFFYFGFIALVSLGALAVALDSYVEREKQQ